MRILYCLLMIVIGVFVVQAFHVRGQDGWATVLCFALLAWLILLGRAVDRAITAMPEWIIRRAMRTPYVHLAGYMERFWLIRIGRRGGGESGPYPLIGARVHHILRSDSDRVFHDHPWPYLTIILRGGYWEVRPVLVDNVVSYTVRTWHGAGSVLLRRANSWHRLELPEGQTAWTLFCTGPKVQHWGFLVGRHKVGWRKYLGVPAGVGED
jgi:hypothetical protein